MAPSHSQPKKAPTKPMWVDVSVLPRIPKIRREGSSVTAGGASQSGSSRDSSSRGSSSHSVTGSNGYGMPETSMNSLAGDKGRQQSVDQQKGQSDSQTQRHRSDGASSSSAFSNSFASSSSSTGSHASQSRYSSSSSSSSTVSFRINSSGNSWHSRRLNIASSSPATGNTVQENWRKKEDEAKKRQLHRDKQMLLASRTPVGKEQENNMYDPFNPTLSDSSSSGDEAESTSLDSSSRQATNESKASSLGNEEGLVQTKQNLVQVKTETQETEVSQEEPRRDQGTISQETRGSELSVKAERESRLIDIKTEKPTLLFNTKVKKEPGLDDADELEVCGDKSKSYLNSQTADATSTAHQSLKLFKIEREPQEEENGHCAGTNYKDDSSRASSSANTKKKQKEEAKSESPSCSKSPLRDSGHKKKTSKDLKDQHSSSSETDRGRRGDHHASGQGDRQKEKDKDKERSSRRSRSRERRRGHSTSDSSQPNSPDRSRRKRRRSRSRSRDETRRRRSRSGSSSSSRERSRRKKQKRRSKERYDDRERDHERRRVSKDKRRGRSRSKSRSKSHSRSRSRSKDRKRGPSKSRSRSRERRKDHTRPQHPSVSSRDKVESRSKDKRRHRSRSNSRERRKEEVPSKSAQKTSSTCVSSSKDTKRLQDKKKEKDITQSSIQEGKVDKVNKQELPSHSFASKVKKESKDLGSDSQTTSAELTKPIKAGKEIKKEKQLSFDMFEDCPISKPIKKEEADTPCLTVNKNVDEGIKDSIKIETCEISITKSEPSSPELCSLLPVTSSSTMTTPVKADSLQDTVSQSHPVPADFVEQQNTVELPVPVKQEVQQPSDSDDDFNVDVMLDNLDYVKSENTEGNEATVKQEKEEMEGKNEAEPVLTLVGAKSKTQVKRVTWNIQEPEGPQPEKSASKVALYKLKLKQEGIRRPSLAVQTSSQDITGAACDAPKKVAAVVSLSTSSRSDGLPPGELSSTGQGEGEEGDLSRKDKYLKKLHMQERAIEEVKLAIKPFYQRRDINKDEYKEILRKAVQKVCHSKSGEINPVKVGNLVKAYVDKYKHARKHKKGEDSGKVQEVQTEAMQISDSP